MSLAELFKAYIPALLARFGSGYKTFILSYLAPGSHVEVGVTLAAYPIVECISSFIAGQLCDRIGRKTTLLIGYTGLIALTLVLYVALRLVRAPPFIASIHGCMGFMASLTLVSTLTMVVDMTHERNRGLGMGVFDFANIFGFSLGYFSASLIYQLMPMPESILPLTALMLVFYALVIKASETKPLMKGVVYLNPLKGIPLKALTALPLWAALSISLGIGVYAGRGLGLGGAKPVEVGALFLGATCVVGLGSIFFGHLSDKLGRWRLIKIGVGGLGIGASILTGLIMMGFSPLIAIAISAPFIFLASALPPAILALTGDEAWIMMRGSAMGLYSLILGFGLGAGNIIGGIAYGYGGLEGLALAVFITLISAIVIHVLLKALTSLSGTLSKA